MYYNSKKATKPNSNKKGGEKITTETYLVLAHECNLGHNDLETMSIGMVLDFIDKHVEMKNPNKKKEQEVIEFADELPWF